MKLKRIFNAKETFVCIETIVETLKSGKYARRVEKLRERVRLSLIAKSDYPLGKDSHLYAFLPAVGNAGYSGIVMLSVPFGDDLSKRDEMLTLLNGSPQTYMTFVGSSGRSLKIMMRYALPDNALPTESTDVRMFHKAAYISACRFVKQLCNVMPNRDYSDMKTPCRISYDPNVYFNPSALKVMMEQPSEVKDDVRPVASAKPLYDGLKLPSYDALQMQLTSFNLVCRKVAFDAEKSEDDALLSLAENCRYAGIDQEFAIRCMLRFDRFRHLETMVRSTFENAYCNHPLGTKQYLTQHVVHQQLLLRFMQQRYVFRRNEVTGSVEYVEHNRYVTAWKPVNNNVINTICVAAHLSGIEVWETDVRRVIGSTLTNDYNPIMEWVSALPAWDGRDRVGELAATVKTRNADWERYFRIWLRSMVRQWTGRNLIHGASMVLMFIGGQGTGKSTFFKRLLPEALQPYYNDRIDFANKKEAERALMRFCLICMDEYDQLSQRQIPFVKHILQKSDVKWRRMYQDEIEQMKRYAAFCATTNSVTPLADATGSRRYLCVELDQPIDNTLQIDHRQLYAQIVHEIANGEQSYFTSEDERMIQERNAYYTQEAPLETMLTSVFSPVDDTESADAIALTSSEIVKELKLRHKTLTANESTVRRVGMLLAAKGFKKRRTNAGCRWYVNLV